MKVLLVMLSLWVGLGRGQRGGNGGFGGTIIGTTGTGGNGGSGGAVIDPNALEQLTPDLITAIFGNAFFRQDQVPAVPAKKEEICAERRGQRLICKTCELCMKETADGPACLKDPTCTDDDDGTISGNDDNNSNKDLAQTPGNN